MSRTTFNVIIRRHGNVQGCEDEVTLEELQEALDALKETPEAQEPAGALCVPIRILDTMETALKYVGSSRNHVPPGIWADAMSALGAYQTWKELHVK